MRRATTISLVVTVAIGLLLTIFSAASSTPAQAAPADDLIITGVFDGPLTGGTPKGVELYVVNDIPDLSIYGIGSANNGGGSDGEEFTFPADSATAGEFIYIASEEPNFTAFFGFAPDYTSGAMAINGDDAIELFANGSVSDIFGDIDVDGTGEPWDHVDGWAYRVNDTGPDGSTFNLANWTFSGIDGLEGGTTNDTTNVPFPIGTFTSGPTAPTVASTNPANGAINVPVTSTVDVTFSEPVTITANWFDLTCTSGVITGTTSPASPATNYSFTPGAPLATDEDCTGTVFGGEISNGDGLTMTTDYTVTFRTVTGKFTPADAFEVEAIGRFVGSGSEIGTHDPVSQTLYVVTGGAFMEILDIADPFSPTLKYTIPVTPYGAGANSVDIYDGIVAAAVQNNTVTDPGEVVFFDRDGNYLGQVTVGALPDMLTFTPDGRYILVANEGEPDGPIDPEGSVSIIDMSNGVLSATVTTLGFTHFTTDTIHPDVRLFPGNTVAEDVEPEYITIAPDGLTAWVALQEANAVAIVDMQAMTITNIVPLGFKDHSLPGNGLDASDRDVDGTSGSGGLINIQNWPVWGMYMPDAIASYEMNGTVYVVTANEGDARTEDARIGSVTLDPVAFPDAATLQLNQNLGRLDMSTIDGLNDDGFYEELYVYGARSFSIWNGSTGELVYDSGSDIEELTTLFVPQYFNANNGAEADFDTRSDNKGPEPEGVVVGEINGRTYAFVGLERTGGVVIYDVTDPNAPFFAEYIEPVDADNDQIQDDISPEGLIFITGEDSPIGTPLLVVNYEVSGSTVIYQLTFDADVSVTAVGPDWSFTGDDVTYAVTLANNSSAVAADFTFTNTFSAGLTYVGDDSGMTPDNPTAGVYVWELGAVPPGFTLTVQLTATVDAGLSSGDVVSNTAVVSTSSPGDDVTDNTAVVNTTTYAIVPIADARAGNNGEIFALEGTVTAPNSTWNNAPEWIFQDATGGIAAFFIANPPIALGDTVRLIGTRGAFNNQEQMTNPIYFEVVSAGTPPDPITYTTGTIAAGDSEGWLVSLEGELSNIPASCGSGYNVTIDDGSGPTTLRIEAATGINVCDLGLQEGDMLGVVGFSTQFQSTFQVKPRSLSDLTFFTDAPVVIDTDPNNGATNVLTNTVLTVSFSEPVSVTANWFDIQCSQSGAVTASSSPAGPSNNYTLTPAAPFVNGDICAVTILADEVSNGDMVNMLNDYTFSFVVGDEAPFGACGDPATGIHFVQGSGDTTPILGTTVVVEAVVVGSYQPSNQFRGFFLQEQDGNVDGNPLTSEGLFVFHETTAVEPGDLVRVRGTATEFNNLTQLGSVTDVQVCDTNYTVTPATMTLPVADMMDWEAAEGMLLTFSHELYVTEHYNLGRFGDVHLSVDDRLWNPTNVVAPGAPALALQDLNNRSRILLDDGLNVQNPDTVIYPDPGLTYTNTLRAGATVPQLTGVLDYRFNSYRIQPVGVVDFVDADVRPEMMDEISGTLKVASFNVLNYFTTLDDNGNICGPSQDMGCRGANSASELERQRIKILNAILAMDADVVGLIEIENNVNDDAVIDLVAGLNDLAGAGTYARIETGTIGTDAIKQAFIYQPATVTPISDYAILDGSVDARFLDSKNRPVLIQTFEDNSSGERFTVAVNHLKSKGSPCDDVGDPDLGDGQGNCNVTRTEAAEALVDFLATDPTSSGTDRFLVIGDLNAYAMEDPIMVLVNDGYTDLLREFYGDQAYSYVFDGQFGHLDHGLANAGLMPFVTGATAWHINADEPRVLDYNTEFKTAAQIDDWFGPGPFRSSDHDPVIVGLAFPIAPTVEIVAPENGAVYTLTMGTTAMTIPVTISTTNFTIPDDGHWHLILNGNDQGPVMDYETMVSLGEGEHVITAELHTPTHTPLGISDSVTVTVVAETILPPPPPVVTAPVSGTEVISQPTFMGTAEPGATIIIRDDDGEPICETIADITGTWTCTLAEGLPLGTQTFSVTASNVAGSSDPVLLTLTVVEETVTPPTFTTYMPLVARP